MILTSIIFGLIRICLSKMPVQMMEETPINTEIGSILSFIPMGIRTIHFQYVSDSPFFSVSDSGKLIVRKAIDLETLCLQHKLCCGLSICIIDVNILVSNNDKEIIVNAELQVRVLDKNDHKPYFSSEEQSVILSEFTQIGTSVSLIPASDGDATVENRLQSYRLNEPSDSFSLDLTHLPSVALRVTRKLDFEEKNKFESIFQACDPELCTSQRLIINIKDENDNSPLFEQDNYNITVKEDAVVGSSIGQVRAHDRDSGKYGEVLYSISVDSDLDLHSTFNINTRNGQIHLSQKLATNTRDFYKLRVQARDSDPLNPKQTMCHVTIKIEDVNDHKPIIKALRNLVSLNITENTGPSYITTFKIIDYDQGKNAIVQCRLDPNCEGSFELIAKSRNVYSLRTIRQFDHEMDQKVDAIIICKDQGEPSLTSIKNIPLYINDVNEFPPSFNTNNPAGFYRSNVVENSPYRTKVITVSATDKDKSAFLVYQMDTYGLEYFQINSQTGEITCSDKLLDREKMSSVTFTVHVTDSTIDPKTANVQVKITVLDANDNSPVFPPQLPQFSVIENTQPTRLTGQLTAKDEDQDENSLVTFSLLNIWHGRSMQRQDGSFHVNPSGYIETLISLDREKCDYYILEVLASDSPRPPLLSLSSKVNITVKVLDENDNEPTWVYPDLNVYNISDTMKPGEPLIQLRAQDKDVGINGQIRFDVISQYRKEMGPSKAGGNSFQYFSLNSSTGHLWISQILHSGTIFLRFRASDHGQPVRSSEINFVINISGDDSSNMNMTIIAVMITVTVVISLFLIVAIICVRRKPPKYHSPTSSVLTKTHPVQDWIGIHPSDEALIAYQPGNKSPYITNIARPVSVVPSTDGTLQMHTFTSNCLPYEPIDGDSGDSGKGPSEEGSNSQHPNQECSNYYSLRQPIRTTFRPCVPIPASPSRSTCHCYVLPEESAIQPGYPTSFPVHSHCNEVMSMMSPMPTNYASYSSLSLPRNQNSISRQRTNSVINKYQQYNPNESNIMNSNHMIIVNNHSGDGLTPRLYSRLTPMHVRRVCDKEMDSSSSQADDRTSSLMASTTSASSSTKTVVYNGQPMSTEVSIISTASSPSYADSIET